MRPEGGGALVSSATPIAIEGILYLPVGNAVIALEGRERVPEILKQCQEVDDIEARAVEVMRLAITQLFEKEGDEAAAWHAMKMRGFYFMQEAVLDHCKRAARTLEEILLENA